MRYQYITHKLRPNYNNPKREYLRTKRRPQSHIHSQTSFAHNTLGPQFSYPPAPTMHNNPHHLITRGLRNRRYVESLTAKRTPYCTRHAGQRKCEFTECSKFAQGKTCFCISHGGGRRCLVSNCTRGARDQKHCAAHGGGRRCRFSKCTKLAVGG